MLTTTPLLTSYAAPTAKPAPTFPLDAYFGEQTNLAINQGGYTTDTGACCSADAPACKVQSIVQGADIREQGSKNRTRVDSPDGIIVSWYGGGVSKEMALVPGSSVNSTHDYACAAYCPLDGGFFSDTSVGDGKAKVKDLGEETVTSQAPGATATTCEHYQWKSTIFGVIPMETDDMYVDFTQTPPQPYYKSEHLTPFGQELGVANLSFVDYAAGDQDK